MDRRKQRTLRNIQSAFLQLRATKPLEHITIRELAEQADISKATFYLYYKDIYDLSEQMQRYVIHEIFEHVTHPELFFSNMTQFLHEIYQIRKKLDIESIYTLFSDRQDLLLEIYTEELRNCLLQAFPEGAEDQQFDVLVTYITYGSYAHMPILKNQDDNDPRWKIINDMTQTLIQKYRPEWLT